MIIQKLALKGFRNHEESILNLGQVNWLTGLSESGKSSILAALEYLLTSRNEWTDGRGTGSKTQVMHGKKSAEVQAITDKGILMRGIPSHKSDTDALWAESLVQCCLRSRHILSLPAKEQKDLFFSLINLPEFDLWAELDAWTPEFTDLGSRFQTFLTGEKKLSTDIDALYTIAYDERRAMTKLLEKEKNTPLMPQPEVKQKVTQKEVCASRKMWEQAVKKLAAEEAKSPSYEDALKQWQTIKAQYDAVDAELAEAEQAVTLAMSGLIPGTEDELEKAQKALSTEEEGIKLLQKQIDVLTGPGKCPPGQCAREQMGELNLQMKGAQEKRSALLQECTTLIKLGNESQRSKMAAEAAEKRWEQAKALRDTLPAMSIDPPAPRAIPQKVVDLRAQILALELSYHQMQYNFRQQELAEQWAEQSRCKAAVMDELGIQVRMFDALCGALAPAGIKFRKLGEALTNLEEQINHKLRHFDCIMEIQPEPWQILVSIAGGELTPVHQLSHSRKSRVSAALQALVAEKQGFPIIGIDEHGLDVTIRPQLIEMLLEQPVQSIVLSTLAERDEQGNVIIPDDPEIPGFKLFYLEHGKVTDLTAPSAPAPAPEPQRPRNSLEDAPGYADGMNAYIASGGRLD